MKRLESLGVRPVSSEIMEDWIAAVLETTFVIQYHRSRGESVFANRFSDSLNLAPGKGYQTLVDSGSKSLVLFKQVRASLIF